MPFLQTSRAAVLAAFLLLSFLLLLILSPFHSDSQSSYSADTHGAIQMLEKHNRIVCRVYRVCHLQNHYILASWMKPYAHLLLTQCGITNPLIFSSISLNKTTQTVNYDLIAPNIPRQRFYQYIRAYLPSFYSPSHLHQSIHNSEQNTIKTTCFSPSGVRNHHPSSFCRQPTELTISYPAILLDQQLPHLNHTYHTIFKQHLKVFDSESIQTASQPLCFRSIISSPLEYVAHQSDYEFSTRDDGPSPQQGVSSILEQIFKTITSRLEQASFDENSTQQKKFGDAEQFQQGRIDDFNPSSLKEATGSRSLRKLLADESPLAKGHMSSNGTRYVKNGKKRSNATAHVSANSTRKLNPLSSNHTNSNGNNHTIEHDVTNKTAPPIDEGHSSQDSKRKSFQGEALTPYMLETSDEGDVGSKNEEYLPTFQYLLDYHPEG